jgi:predicted MFS family arabinose efflux permease
LSFRGQSHWYGAAHNSAVACTQLGLFSASTNLAIVYMTWADGQGYKHFGMRGLLLTDSFAGMASAVLLLVLLWNRLRRPDGQPELAAVAGLDSAAEPAD